MFKRNGDVYIPTQEGSVSLQVVANSDGNREVYNGCQYAQTIEKALQQRCQFHSGGKSLFQSNWPGIHESRRRCLLHIFVGCLDK